ncbi:MAG: VOC family protein [Pseudomonadota bacterium]
MKTRISPFLWFDTRAEEAARFYCAIFPNSGIDSVARYPEGTPGTPGTVMTVGFHLDGQRFTALNGGPVFTFSQAISFVIDCETQAEIDHYWEHLAAGGSVQQCGWLIDRYGIAWQVVPTMLPALLAGPDQAKARRVTDAFMKMVKFDIAALERAAAGK